MIDRESALKLLKDHGPEAHMLAHALFSEAVMRALAAHFGEDEEIWALTGLLHDLDYPRTRDKPERHGQEGAAALRGLLPEEALQAIAAHNSEYTGLEPRSRLDYALRAAETVTGLVHSAALLRPTGMEGMQVKSLKKKMKDKAFAAAVSRERIRECEKAGIGLDDFLALAIAALTPLHD